MLQQTQVATVIPYYARFLERFPDLASLAAASSDDVLALWSGLGYYSRARNLHRAAREIVSARAGRFPRDFDAVLALPGVGRSTAAAVCVFAFGARHAILDGNVKRVYARCFGVAGYPGDARVATKLWELAQAQLPARGVESYTQGLMDLGALVCTRGKPRCDQCPVAGQCVAKRTGTIAEYPAPRPRKSVPRRRTRMLLLVRGGEVMLEKRPPSGIWGGMWSLPEAESGDDLHAICMTRYGADIVACETWTVMAHGFTHFKLDIEPVCVEVGRRVARIASPATCWLLLDDALAAAIPAPVKRILAALAARRKPGDAA